LQLICIFIFFGKIATLIPEICTKGELRPSTFKVANLVPQLSFFGQTRPRVDVLLYVSNGLMQKVHFTLGSSMLNMHVLIFS
jgi:hypothetical protein